MKALDRRYGDVEKRLQRKTQVLELTRKGVESARADIDAARAWVADRLRELAELPPLGSSVRAAEERQQALKAMAKEAEGKQVRREQHKCKGKPVVVTSLCHSKKGSNRNFFKKKIS